MQTKPILVSGLCRCGSSLTMQMLHAAGISCLGERPAFEPECVGFNPARPATVLTFAGASKVLDPFHDTWPERFDAKIIWLDRDRKQQAKSQVKMVQTFSGVAIPGQAWRAIAKQLREDRDLSCRKFWSHCQTEPLFLRFEELINTPLRSARLIAAYVGVDISAADLMARCVIGRDSDCAKDMGIEARLIEAQ